MLEDPKLEQIAIAKVEGCQNAGIVWQVEIFHRVKTMEARRAVRGFGRRLRFLLLGVPLLTVTSCSQPPEPTSGRDDRPLSATRRDTESSQGAFPDVGTTARRTPSGGTDQPLSEIGDDAASQGESPDVPATVGNERGSGDARAERTDDELELRIDGQIRALREELGKSGEHRKSDTARPEALSPRLVELHAAAAQGDVERVRSLIQEAPDLLSNSVLGHTVLHTAVLGAIVPERETSSNAPVPWEYGESNRAVVLLLLDSGADVNAENDFGWTPLHFAAMVGRKRVAEVLLSRKARIHMRGKSGSTPLHVAARLGHRDVVARLLAANANPDATDHAGLTALHQVASHEDVDVLLSRAPTDQALEKLIGVPTSVLTQIGAGLTARQTAKQMLERSSGSEHKEVAELLLASRADVDAKTSATRRTPLHVAASSGNISVAGVLLENGADANERDLEGYEPLHVAAERGQKDMTELLLRRSDVNVRTNLNLTPLHLSAGHGHSDVAGLLLARGARVDAGRHDIGTPLFGAAGAGHGAAVKLLLEHDASVHARDRRGRTPLHAVAMRVDPESIKRFVRDTQKPLPTWGTDHREIAAVLLSHGAEVDARAGDGFTPLFRAAITGQHTIIDILLEHKADVDARVQDNKTRRAPLHGAAFAGHERVLELLLAGGANIEIQDNFGMTPLHWASHNGHVGATKVLLAGNANVNCEDWAGRTPLHWAAEHGHAKVVEVLLVGMARVNPTDNSGRTPAMCAAQRDERETLDLLRRYGAQDR